MKIKCPHCGEEFDHSLESLAAESTLEASLCEYLPGKSAHRDSNHLGRLNRVELVELPAPESLPSISPYAGQSVCFTGFNELDKVALQGLAKTLGMQSKSSVSHSLNLLVCGANAGPGKVRDAQSYGVKILSYEDFKASLKS